MDRQKYNRLILEEISKYIEEQPDLRFGQILLIMGICQMEEPFSGFSHTWKDEFNTESKEIYEDLTKYEDI